MNTGSMADSACAPPPTSTTDAPAPSGPHEPMCWPPAYHARPERFVRKPADPAGTTGNLLDQLARREAATQ
jgi:hypothetical protein